MTRFPALTDWLSRTSISSSSHGPTPLIDGAEETGGTPLNSVEIITSSEAEPGKVEIIHPEVSALQPQPDPAAADAWQFLPLDPLSGPRLLHTANLLEDGAVLVIGGKNQETLGSVERFQPETKTWSQRASLNFPRYFHSSTQLADGRILLVAGGTAAKNSTSPWRSTIPSPMPGGFADSSLTSCAEPTGSAVDRTTMGRHSLP